MALLERPPFRYFGGKFKIRNWIIEHFPNHRCYVEPFAGSASIFLAKKRVEVEVINDISSEITNFFAALRDHHEQLVNAIKLTPYSRDELELTFDDTDDSVERARRFYARTAMAWGATDRYGQAFRVSKVTNVTQAWKSTTHLQAITDRLLDAIIENRPAIEVIKKFDSKETLFYLDPPYPHSTRTHNHKYFSEMSTADHRELLDVIKNVQGMVVLSSYENVMYNEMGWHMATMKTLDAAKNEKTECLYLSPALLKRARQMRLF